MDNRADHMEAVLDTEWGIQYSLAVVVHSQVAEDSRQDSPGNHQLSVAADNSCKDYNLVAIVEQWDMACCSELLDMVLLPALYCTHIHTHTHHQTSTQAMLYIAICECTDEYHQLVASLEFYSYKNCLTSTEHVKYHNN